MGESGLGPKELELTSVYRVEECINGRPLTFLELRNPSIGKKLMNLICEVNYDEKLKNLIKSRKGLESNHSNDFMKEDGWFGKYLKEVKPEIIRN